MWLLVANLSQQSLWCLHVEDHGLGPPAGELRPPVTVMEELVAMTTSGDDTSEGAKGEEGEVHMYMELR